MVCGFIKEQNNPEFKENSQKREDMMDIMFKEFVCIGMSEEEKAEVLMDKCGYASKNAYREIRSRKINPN